MTRRKVTGASFNPHDIMRGMFSHATVPGFSIVRADTKMGLNIQLGKKYETYDGDTIRRVNTLREVNEIINA